MSVAAPDPPFARMADESIALSQQQLAEAQRLARVGSFDWEIGPNVVTFTDELLRIYGLLPGQLQRTFEGLLARVHPEDRERTRGVLFDAFRGEAPFSYDHRVVRPDGSVRTLQTRGGVVRDAHGKPVRVVATSWDITEQTAAVAERERSRSLLQATLEATDEAVLVVDRAGKIVLTNDRLLSLWRIAEARVAAMDAQALFDFMREQADDPDGFRAGVLGLEGRVEDESTDLVRLKDGRMLERHTRPQRIGAAVVGRVWSFRDVSERESLLQHAVFLADATLLLESLDVEQAMAAVARLVVRQLAWGCAVELASDDGAPRTISAWRDPDHPRAVAPHPGVRAGRALLYEADGVPHLGVPIITKRGVDGAVTLCAAPLHTYGKQELELTEELARRVALALDNARLYRHAEAAVRARDEFLAIAAHEIRGPISTLHLAVQLLRVDDAKPDARERHLELIERQDRRLARFVDELIDLSRIRAGAMRYDLEDDVDFAEIVRAVAQRLAPELQQAGSELSLELAGPVRGRWDRLRLDQVVSNLLSNAIKFGPRRPIRIALSARADQAELIVQDQGIGIADELHERIFRPFERGVSVRNYGGLGLGLYIVRTIVEGMGGRVSVASEKGAGATFTVQLPTT
jgi:PAS domain S-box-containing protein